VAGEPTPELEQRRAALDVHPTGPMWGDGDPASSATVRELEAAVSQRFAPVTAALAGVGLVQERRALRLRVEALRVEFGADAMTVELRRGPGVFATAVLRELLLAGEV